MAKSTLGESDRYPAMPETPDWPEGVAIFYMVAAASVALAIGICLPLML